MAACVMLHSTVHCIHAVCLSACRSSLTAEVNNRLARGVGRVSRLELACLASVRLPNLLLGFVSLLVDNPRRVRFVV